MDLVREHPFLCSAELKSMKVPAGNPAVGRNKRILVVGGGISGLTAASEASRAGYEVVLVKKTGALGDLAAMRLEPHCCLYSRIALFCGTCPFALLESP
jgi:quinone-modifying oxidoreductase subunit QmoB